MSNHQDNQWKEFVNKIRSGLNISFEEHVSKFQEIYSDRKEEYGPPLVRQPEKEHFTNSNIGQFMKELGFENYTEFHKWTGQNRADFWESVIDHLSIIFLKEPEAVLHFTNGVKNPQWLKGAELNCVDSCFTAERDKPAIVFGKELSPEINTITYGELERIVNRIANGLLEHGFKKGDRIAIYMPMNVECVAVYMGIIRAGCQVVSIADSFSSAELKKRLEIVGAYGIVTVDEYNRAGKTINLFKKVKEADSPRAIIVNSNNGIIDLREGDILWNDFLSSKNTFESVIADPYQVTNILFSSGTTGTPKAIPWTQITPVKCGMDGHFHQDIQEDDVVAWPTNVGWMMGPWLIYATFLNNASMALYEGAPVGEGFIKFIQDTGVTMLGVVPSLVKTWRSSEIMQNYDWKKIKVFSSTGEPSNKEDYLWLMSLTDYRAPVIEYLGGTEIGGGYITGTVVQPASPATFTTPALGLDFLILNEENKPVYDGEMGELFLILPSIGLSQELLNKGHDEEYYKGCPAGPNGEVLRRHGDQMMKLYKGFYKAHGRADDTMNIGGIKISSLELETVFEQHELVYESAAVSVQPEGEGQEKLVVFVVLEKEVEVEILKKELESLISKKLNPLFKIYKLVITNELPRTASNKLMRRKLRADFIGKK